MEYKYYNCAVIVYDYSEDMKLDIKMFVPFFDDNDAIKYKTELENHKPYPNGLVAIISLHE